MSATWKSNRAKVERTMDRANVRGLTAAAYIVSNAVKKELRGGYVSGDFVTGTSINRVTIGAIERAGKFEYRIRIGTNLLYNLYWEIGHYNIFLRRFVRVEKWRTAALGSVKEAREAYARVYVRTMKEAS